MSTQGSRSSRYTKASQGRARRENIANTPNQHGLTNNAQAQAQAKRKPKKHAPYSIKCIATAYVYENDARADYRGLVFSGNGGGEGELACTAFEVREPGFIGGGGGGGFRLFKSVAELVFEC